MKIKITLFLALLSSVVSLKSQQLCENELILDIKIADSRCSGNGNIKITPSSPSGHVSLIDVFYVVNTRGNLTLSDDELKNPSTQTEFFVPKGSYYVYAVALCNISGNKELFKKGPFTVGYSYPEFTSSSMFSTVITPINCGGTINASQASFTMSSSGGRPPYKITLTKYPAGYTEPTTVNIATGSYVNHTFKKVIPGTYAGMIQDSCGNTMLFNDSLVAAYVEPSYTFTASQTLTPTLDGHAVGQAKLGSVAVVAPGFRHGYYSPLLTFTSYPAEYTPPVGGITASSSVQASSLPKGNYTWEIWNYCKSIKIATGSFTITTKLNLPIPSNLIKPTINITKNYGDGRAFPDYPFDNYAYNNCYYDNLVPDELNNYNGSNTLQDRLYGNNIIRLTFDQFALTNGALYKDHYSIFTYPDDFDVILYGGNPMSNTYLVSDSVTCTTFRNMNQITVQNCNYDMWQPTVVASMYPDGEITLPFTHKELLNNPTKITRAVIRNRTMGASYPKNTTFNLTLPAKTLLTFSPTLREQITSPTTGGCGYTFSYYLKPFTLVEPGIYGQNLSIKVYNKQTARVDTVFTIYDNIFELESGNNNFYHYSPVLVNPAVGDQYTISVIDSYGQTIATQDYTIPARGALPARQMPYFYASTSWIQECGYSDKKAYTYFTRSLESGGLAGGVVKLISAPVGAPPFVADTIPLDYKDSYYYPYTKYFSDGVKPSNYSIYGYLPEGQYVFEFKDGCNDSIATLKSTISYLADNPYIWRDTPPTITEVSRDNTGTTYTIENWEDCQTGGYKTPHYAAMRVYGHTELNYNCCPYMGGYGQCPFTDYEYWNCSPQDMATSIDQWGYPVEQKATIKVTELMDSVHIRVYADYSKFSTDTEGASCYYKDYVVGLKSHLVAFDSEITGGYRCPGAAVGTGFITVKAKDGQGPFTFNLYASQEALIARNPIKTFDFSDPAQRQANFSDWPATGNDRLYVEIVDKGHNRTINGPVMLQDLTNSAMISIAGAQRKCEGDDLQLLCVPLGETTYHWKAKDYESYARNPLILNIQETKVYSVDIKVTGCDVAGVPLTVTRSLEVPVAPRLMFWSPDAEDNNWNKKSNWLKKNDGGTYEPANSYPAPCTSVHIQSNQGGFYPALDPAHSTGAVGYPICDTIVYHYGAATYYPQYLQYKSARVQYNFGFYNKAFVTNGQPRANIEDGFVDILDPVAPLARTKWYSLAAPMKKMTGGDFGVGPYPMIYQRTLLVPEVTEPTPAYPSFTGEFATQNIDLSTGTNYNSLALWVPPYRSTVVGMKNHSTLENLKGILEIPYFDNPSIMQYRPLNTYNATLEKSSFQYYNTYEPHGALPKFDEISRGREAFRFVYENVRNRPDTIVYNGQTMEAYTMPLATTSKGRFIMVGNPFMSHINFDKLYAANSGVIDNRYMMYSGGTYKTYLPGIGGELTSPSIPPLQAVILKVKDTPTENSIKFPMGGIAEGYSVFGVNHGTVVKSGTQTPTLRTTQGQIVLDGIVGDNHIVSKLLFNYPDFDNMSKAIYPANMSTKAETFFIDEKGIINQYQAEKARRTTVALGLQSTNTGTIRLQFTKVGDLPVESVHLVDKELGTRTELVEEVTNYDFTHRYSRVEAGQTGLDSKRFELQIVYRATVGLEDAENGANSLSVLCNKHHLKVKSSLGLKGIELLDMQGRSVYTDSASEYLYERELDGLVVGAYLVKVSFVDGTVSHKKIIIE